MTRRRRMLFLAALNILHAACLSFSFSFGLQHKLRRSGSHPRRHIFQLLSSANINVYDNIFDADACLLLHGLAVDHCNRCEAGSIFMRTPDKKDKLTPLEKAVDTILNALNDTSPIVEYWSRSCYINIDAHADIDENTLKQDGVLRCPKNAHVLYMQVTSDDDRSKRMGPTVVFPQRKVAWGSTTAIPSISGGEEYIVDVENDWEKDGNSDKQHNNDNIKNDEMVIVPAKTGRLLRFDGRAFHSVPKPPHRYVMSKKELNLYLQQEEADCDKDEYWDDEYDELGQEETDLTNLRSVLLFNTWPEGSSGPRGVLPDTFDVDEDDMPDDIELYSSSYYEYQSHIEKERLETWQKEYGDDFEQLHCNGVEDWDQVVLEQMASPDSEGNVVIPLMGNPSRRGCDIMQDVLCGPSKMLREMFYESEQVSVVDLTQTLE